MHKQQQPTSVNKSNSNPKTEATENGEVAGGGRWRSSRGRARRRERTKRSRALGRGRRHRGFGRGEVDWTGGGINDGVGEKARLGGGRRGGGGEGNGRE